jgi:hypothetical protein
VAFLEGAPLKVVHSADHGFLESLTQRDRATKAPSIMAALQLGITQPNQLGGNRVEGCDRQCWPGNGRDCLANAGCAVAGCARRVRR